MYKIRIMNFRPYEHEVLYKQLEQLGKDGYYTDDLSLVSIFKKKDHPVYYKIDFLNTKGLKKTEKRKQKEIFYDPYLDKDYQPIYNKRGMYVFVGKEKFKKSIDYKDKKDYIDFQTFFQYLWNTIGALILCLGFAFISLQYATIDTFLSYGITVVYVGILLLLATCVYRNIINTIGISKFKNQIQKQQKAFSLSMIKKTRLIYLVLSIISCLLIAGGLVEDSMNAKTFTLQEHQMLTLKDLNMTLDYKSSTQKHHSFTVPTSYQYLEVAGETIIYTKEYHLSSSEKATQLMKDFQNNPKQYLCKSIKLKENIIYGYYDDTLTTLIIQKDNVVALISFEMDITQEQINTIINFYK
ncbi:MAG: hypothetical protein RR518_00465 [Coprobacillus sp.]